MTQLLIVLLDAVWLRPIAASAGIGVDLELRILLMKTICGDNRNIEH